MRDGHCSADPDSGDRRQHGCFGLLAWVASSKYFDHLPLYQIEPNAASQGVPLADSTLAEWTGRIEVALQPLVDLLAELLHERPCLHADETPARQLDPGIVKTKHAYCGPTDLTGIRPWSCSITRTAAPARTRRRSCATGVAF